MQAARATQQSTTVLILGGGLAGLGLAIQLKRARPELAVTVLERREGEAPLAAFKVGESTVEIAAHYLRDTLGLAAHLDTQQLPKMGLRYFLAAAPGDADIANRAEVGPAQFPEIRTYQLDRGLLENEMAAMARTLGVDLLNGVAKVVATAPHTPDSAYTVHAVLPGGETRLLHARWLVDATGRAALLKKLWQLDAPSAHGSNAAWFRVDQRVAVDNWSAAPGWQTRVTEPTRWLSTVHLMGRGYWVWLIPLSSGSTSIGIVADPALHPAAGFNTFARALVWLQHHEPRLALALQHSAGHLQDFRTMRHFSHAAKRVFSPARWALIGEAGVFLDPLYSPGSDFIAIANTFLADLILRDTQGEPIARRAEYFNAYFLNFFTNSLAIYEDQYLVMGSPRVMREKIVWDTLVYWSSLALLALQQRLCDLLLLERVRPLLGSIVRLNVAMQTFFRETATAEATDEPAQTAVSGFLNLTELPCFYAGVYQGLLSPLDNAGLELQLARNVAALERTSRSIQESLRPSPLNPRPQPQSSTTPSLHSFVSQGGPHHDHARL